MTSPRRSRARRSAVAAAAFALLLAACGSDSGDDAAADAPTEESAADEAPETEPAPEPEAETDTEADASGGEVHQMGPAIQETAAVSFVPDTQLTPFADGEDPMIGAASPVIEGQRFDGTDITIGGPTDQPTLYVFLAHWCPHCNDEIPELIELRDDGRLPADLNVVGISTATAEDRQNFPPSDWFADNEWPWDVMADDENLTAIQVFGGNSFPYAVVVAEDGSVLARRAGSGTADDIANWIDAALSIA